MGFVPHKYAGLRVTDILRLKKASVKAAPLPAGSKPWVEIELLTWEQVEDAAQANEVGFKTVRRLLTDQRFDR